MTLSTERYVDAQIQESGFLTQEPRSVTWFLYSFPIKHFKRKDPSADQTLHWQLFCYVIIDDFRHGTSTCWTPENWVSSILTMTCPTTPSTVLRLSKTGTLSSRDHGYKLLKRYSLKLFRQLSPLIAECHKRSWLIEPCYKKILLFSVLHNQPQRPPSWLSEPEGVYQGRVPPHRWPSWSPSPLWH